MVLLHGMANSLQSFRLVAPLLAKDYYVITVDTPGFGLSAKPDDFDYRTGNVAHLVGDFIRALGMEQAIVGGHSMGGLIAMRVALDEPEIIGLVVMNPGIINSRRAADHEVPAVPVSAPLGEAIRGSGVS